MRKIKCGNVICGMRIENRTRSLVIGFGHDLTLRICRAKPFILV